MDALTLTMLGLLAVDTAQTLNIARECQSTRPQYHESNVILGKCPSQPKVVAYMAAAMIAYPSIMSAVPERWHGLHARKILQGVTIGMEAKSVYVNYSLGLGFSF